MSLDDYITHVIYHHAGFCPTVKTFVDSYIDPRTGYKNFLMFTDGEIKRFEHVVVKIRKGG